MKKFISMSFLVLSICVSSSAFAAGWGAIACNNSTGACSVSWSWPNYESAANYALSECGGNCSIVKWEHNECVYWGAAYACN